MYNIVTLDNFDLNKVLKVFNKSFENYFVAVSLTLEGFERKLALEDVDLSISLGCVQNNDLVAFILHGIRLQNGKFDIHNAGTGVLPEHRGNNLTFLMYHHFLANLLPSNTREIILEVIAGNSRAESVYKKIGFHFREYLHCFTAPFQELSPTKVIPISKETSAEIIDKHNFWDFSPHWQNDVLNKVGKLSYIQLIAAWEQDFVIGYGLFNSTNNRLLQLAVHQRYRRKGVASAVLNYIVETYETPINVINVSSKGDILSQYFKNHNAITSLLQKSMVLSVDA